MAPFKSRAYVLGSSDYRETSRLLQVFCEDQGRLSLVARGLRSPKSRKATAAETFNLVQVTYSLKQGATLGTLSSIDTERSYEAIRSDLDAYALASYWFDVIWHTSQPGMAWQALFLLTQDFLAQLEQHSGPSLLSTYWHRLLAELGVGLQMSACGNCGTVQQLCHVDVDAGMVLCAGCAVPGRVYFPLGISDTGAVPSGTRTATTNLLSVLVLVNQVLRVHLDVHLKSFDFAAKTLRGSGYPKHP